jgi:predicted ATPase
VFVEALDEYVAGLEPDRLAVLDEVVQAELAHIFPSLSALAGGHQVSPQHERYRSHRAVRALLEHLAQSLPLVLVLDDFHWADSASVELLGALLRRPPAAVLTAVALRPRQTRERLAIMLERAHRSAAVTRVDLGALTLDEARQLLGERFDVASAALLYQESGGNPFYLEQLARSPARAPQFTSAAEISLTGLGVPAAAAASLAEELTLLSDVGRLVLEGAAVAGDPFELELAAAAAATSEAAGMYAIDELLGLDLIRATDVPRRFRFRHPLVRRAVYEATAGGWRLGAHQRCAQELGARGASMYCAPTEMAQFETARFRRHVAVRIRAGLAFGRGCAMSQFVGRRGSGGRGWPFTLRSPRSGTRARRGYPDSLLAPPRTVPCGLSPAEQPRSAADI